MKVLILQLARLGDLFQTLPVVKSLRRDPRVSEVHVLSRKGYASIFENYDLVDQHWPLDSRGIFSPLVDETPDIDAALQQMGLLIDSLHNEKFDVIINLSFSPFSSRLLPEIAHPESTLAGYSRWQDDSLRIPDDSSAYFYAQVGPEKPNRIHITDLFASVGAVQLVSEDWVLPPVAASDDSRKVVSWRPAFGRDYILIHVGASQLGKTLSWPKWQQVVRRLLSHRDHDVVLIGAKDEQELAARITAMEECDRLVNLVGLTSLVELIEVVRGASLLIGGDSGPVHIASMTDTPVLNVSLAGVCYWETGPRSPGSRVICIENEGDLPSDILVAEAWKILRQLPSDEVAAFVDDSRTCVRSASSSDLFSSAPGKLSRESEFEWELTQALYMGGAFPSSPDHLFDLALKRLNEVNRLALEQIEEIRRRPSNTVAAEILTHVDEIIEQVSQWVSTAGPLVRWFQTEKLRIGPLPLAELIEVTFNLHSRFGEVIGLYSLSPVEQKREENAI